MTGPNAIAVWLRVSAAVRRAPHQTASETIGVPGWILHGDESASLSASVAVSANRPGVVAVVHAAGGGAELDRVAHTVLRTLTQPRTVAWDHRSIPNIFNEAHAVVQVGPSSDFRLGAALLVVLGSGAVFAAGVGDIRVYRVVDGYAGQLTTGQPSAGDAPSAATDHDCWLGGPQYRDPTAYAVPSHPADRLLISTAGLHRTVQPSQLATLARGEQNAAAVNLVAAAEAARPGITATAVLIDLPAPTSGPEAPSQRPFRRRFA